MEFIVRSRELDRFDCFFHVPGQSVAFVYGRRRVGKSELIKQALRGYDGTAVYYECKQTPFLILSTSSARMPTMTQLPRQTASLTW